MKRGLRGNIFIILLVSFLLLFSISFVSAGWFSDLISPKVTGKVISSTPCENRDTIGLYDPVSSHFYLRNSNDIGMSDIDFGYGNYPSSWLPVIGDWDNKGIDFIGLYDPSNPSIYLKKSNTAGNADIILRFATTNGLIPISGDWQGTGTNSIGLYNPATSWFTFYNGLNQVIGTMGYGSPNGGLIPIAGDWDSDGKDSIGLYDPVNSVFMLRNSLTTGMADYTFGYGARNANWKPIAGDWNGDGADGIGLYDPVNSVFMLRNSLTTGIADYTFSYGQKNSRMIPVAGDFDGKCGTVLRCSDSDGLNYTKKGNVTGVGSGELYEDYCLANGDLIERYCGNATDFTTQYHCPNGCSNGACLESPVREVCNLLNGQFQDNDRDGCHAGLDSDCGGVEGVDDKKISCNDGIDNDCDGMIDYSDNDGTCNQERDNTKEYFANSYCKDNEVAIVGVGGGVHDYNNVPVPSLSTFGGIQRMGTVSPTSGYELKGWSVGSQKKGSIVIESLCVDKSKINYRISQLGQTQHYSNDDTSYFAQALCNDNEVAIGGQGGCNVGGEIRPELVVFEGIQRSGTTTATSGYELMGWTVGCKGYGSAVVEAICVDKNSVSYRISRLGGHTQSNHYIDDQEAYRAEALCNQDEIAIGGQGGCNEGGSTGHQMRPVMTAFTNKMSGFDSVGWVVECKGYGSAVVEAICVKKNNFPELRFSGAVYKRSTDNDQCTDSDGYLDYSESYYKPGTVTGLEAGAPSTATDICNGNTLREYSCGENPDGNRWNYKWEDYVCPNGCDSTIGACIRGSEVSCIDSDGLTGNIFGKTTIQVKEDIFVNYDICAIVLRYDEKGIPADYQSAGECSGVNCYVDEAICMRDDSGKFINAPEAGQLIKCENGCKGGVCLGGTGESYKLEKASTRFYLGSGIRDVVSGSVTKDDLPNTLRDVNYYDINNNEFTYTQRLFLENLTYQMFSDADYMDGEPSLGMKVISGTNIFNYSLDFANYPSIYELKGTEIEMLGAKYYVLKAGPGYISMIESPISINIQEGETQSATIDGKTYEIKADLITEGKAKFTVNDVSTNTLSEGNVQKLQDGSYILVQALITNVKSYEKTHALISIGRKKVVIANGSNVEVNDESITGLTGIVRSIQPGDKLSQIKLVFNADDDQFVSDKSSITLPGLGSIKLSYGGMNVNANEIITVRNNGQNQMILERFPLKDSTETIPLVYGDSSGVFKGIGFEENKRLVTSNSQSIIFDDDTDDSFIASWSDGKNGESYLMAASNFESSNGINTTNIKISKSGTVDGSEIIKQDAKEGDTIIIGNVELHIGHVDYNGKSVNISAGSSTNFFMLYSRQGLALYFPNANSIPTGTPWKTVTLTFSEEDKNENVGLGKYIGLNLGWNDQNQVEVKNVSVERGGIFSEIGIGNYRNYVYSPLASQLDFIRSGDQDSFKMIYHGGESYGNFYLESILPEVSSPIVVVPPVKKCDTEGIRRNGQYCDSSYRLVNQKASNELCENNFECKSNICIDSKCVDSGIWRKFIEWISSMFGKKTISNNNGINSINKNVKSEITNLFASPESKIVIYPTSRQISVKQGSKSGFAFSIRNVDSSEQRFDYTVEADPENVLKDCGITSDNANKYLLNSAGKEKISANSIMENPILVTFNVPESSHKCDIKYNIKVLKNGNLYAKETIFMKIY